MLLRKSIHKITNRNKKTLKKLLKKIDFGKMTGVR